MNLNFKPEINDYSRKLIEKKNIKEKIVDKLKEIGKEYNKKLSISKNEKNKAFTYKPSINKKTEHFGKLKRKKREENLKNHLSLINLKNSNNSKCKTENNSKVNKSYKNDNIKQNNEKKDNKNFQKTINLNNSKKIRRKNHAIKKIPTDLFDYLYIESEILQKKRKREIKENMVLNYPFKPKINKSYENQNKNKEENVFERLNKINTNFFKRKTIIIKNKNKFFNSKIKYELYNSLTNRNNYYPKIKRIPANPDKRNLSSENPKSYNNIVNEKIKISKMNKHNFEIKNKNEYLQKSKNIIIEVKNIKYKELFNILDSDEDGLISYKKIKLTELDFQQLIILIPILKELQYKRNKMDLNMFVDRIEKI